MPYIKKNPNNNQSVNLFFEDLGSGQPVILIHGWPVSHEMWEYQVAAIVNSGYRCIAYDRRGFGQSDKPWSGYDYDTLAADLNDVIEALDLSNVILVGFSMGGGEVARYLGKYGSSKVEKAVFVSSVVPLLLQTEDHEEGVPLEVFDGIIANVQNDRPAFLTDFGKQFFSEGVLNKPVSHEIQQWMHQLAVVGSPKATVDCVRSFSETDFRTDLSTITIPVMIVHGDDDKVVPHKATGELAASLLPNAEYYVIEGAPHGLFVTHKTELNHLLINFLKKT
ncbi:alpha/beta fold hydrolase [Pedobacter sp. MC2016-24]|uniref:alpha/beta fold hydrolase n=1 Tax=Pedobacter sp. MC2016-24 TaxID=2780090 RepID=UPI0018818722|nr:alpha/beta hydrolase [Pedobacter sp. MC2016-24]MBE9597723.1 alpha/beta hydrolase [Pedobacter sp. MC2016-24]